MYGAAGASPAVGAGPARAGAAACFVRFVGAKPTVVERLPRGGFSRDSPRSNSRDPIPAGNTELPLDVASPRDGTLLGSLFESLLTLNVRVYAQAAEASLKHLRTTSGDHEVDLIVERGDGRVVAIEVKLARTVNDDDARHLRWLARRAGTDLLDAIILTTGEEAYRRTDGIGVVPAALLGP